MEQSPKVKDGAKFRERRVFLFEQIIIISEELERKKNALTQPGYIYKNSLLVSIRKSNVIKFDFGGSLGKFLIHIVSERIEDPFSRGRISSSPNTRFTFLAPIQTTKKIC